MSDLRFLTMSKSRIVQHDAATELCPFGCLCRHCQRSLFDPFVSCFAMWDIETVTKERAKELGMEVRSSAAGSSGKDSFHWRLTSQKTTSPIGEVSAVPSLSLLV
jgi:hypothetical protein